MNPTTATAAGAPAVVGIDIGGTGTRFVAIDPSTGLRLGASDPREDGAALGY